MLAQRQHAPPGSASLRLDFGSWHHHPRARSAKGGHARPDCQRRRLLTVIITCAQTARRGLGVTGHGRNGKAVFAEKVLRPGNTAVQNGTRHRWGNRGTEPAVVAVFTIRAHRAGE
jgi:hypothetical protein